MRRATGAAARAATAWTAAWASAATAGTAACATASAAAAAGATASTTASATAGASASATTGASASATTGASAATARLSPCGQAARVRIGKRYDRERGARQQNNGEPKAKRGPTGHLLPPRLSGPHPKFSAIANPPGHPQRLNQTIVRGR